MRCPFCHYYDSKVIDSRSKDEGKMIRRRRECLECGKRFTTREEVEQPIFLVIKSDGRREPFDRQKMKKGIVIACTKRPISIDLIDSIVSKVEGEVLEIGHEEIETHDLGRMIMKELKLIDEVAYVRFASVYRKFADKEEFLTELNELN